MGVDSTNCLENIAAVLGDERNENFRHAKEYEGLMVEIVLTSRATASMNNRVANAKCAFDIRPIN